MAAKVPDTKVTVGEKDVETALGGTLGCIRAELDMDGVSSASVEVIGAYDVAAHSLDGTLSGSLLPGSKIEIQLGYVGDKSKVFAGYVDSIELEADQDISYIMRIHAADVVKLMKENRNVRILTEKKHSDVFDTVLGSYSWTGTTSSCDDTDAYDKDKCWYQDESDYDFVMRELVKRCPNDREFYVSNGTAYYKEPKSDTEVMTVNSDSEVFRIRAVKSFLNRTVKIYGNSSGYEVYTGSSDAAADSISSGAEKGCEAYADPDGDSQDMVDGIASAMASKLGRQTKRIEVLVAGDPKLLTGAYVKVSELDAVWNGTYRIRRAVHRCDEEGYQTEMTLEGS